MKAYVRKEKEEGVSPVIATILMVAITVVLAATLYLMVGSMGGEQNITPPIKFVAQKTGTTNWTLQVSADNLRPIDLKYAIQKADGTYIVTGAQFPTTSGTEDANGVTWYDANGDGKVNTGDTIAINNANVASGDTFVITAGATGSATLP